MKPTKKTRLTEGREKAFEAEMKAAGITVVKPTPGRGTITLPKKPDGE